jgi:hypothetical protein
MPEPIVRSLRIRNSENGTPAFRRSVCMLSSLTKKPVVPLPGARQPTYSEDGVDLTLIRWMLSLSPAERLRVLQENVRSILRLRREQTQLSLDTSDSSRR